MLFLSQEQILGSIDKSYPGIVIIYILILMLVILTKNYNNNICIRLDFSFSSLSTIFELVLTSAKFALIKIYSF